MHKFIRRSAAAILAASMLFSNSMTALASQDDSNYGPHSPRKCQPNPRTAQRRLRRGQNPAENPAPTEGQGAQSDVASDAYDPQDPSAAESAAAQAAAGGSGS